MLQVPSLPHVNNYNYYPSPNMMLQSEFYTFHLRLVISSTAAKYLDHLDHQFQVIHTEMIRGNQA